MELADKYMAESYVQHNPNVPTGRAAFVEFFSRDARPVPIEPRDQGAAGRDLADGDYVVLSFAREYADPEGAGEEVHDHLVRHVPPRERQDRRALGPGAQAPRAVTGLVGFARAALLPAVLAAPFGTALAIDLQPLWDFSKPEVSEQRFRAALATASGDDALILQTQIARTYGLRGDFVRAREILREIEAQPASASAEVRTRHALEYGRTWVSATHPPELLTPAARAQARAAFMRAVELSRAARLDGLTVDALHMLAFVETDLEAQLKWNEDALDLVEASAQPAAKAWEASLRNNAGYTLHQLGRDREALVQFERAVELRERGTDGVATRTAWWMVASTLRSLGRANEALEIQLRLERENDAAGTPDPEVFEELEYLFLARGDAVHAARYAQRRKALAP